MSPTATTKAQVGLENEQTETTFSPQTEQFLREEKHVDLSDQIASRPSLLAEIRGLGTLKDGAYSVDFENTVTSMAQIIANMESQLDQVLSLNTVLKNDLNVCKEIIVENKVEKTRLEEKIGQLQTEIPSKRELLMEIDQLIDDRSNAQNKIHELNARCTHLSDSVNELGKKVSRLEEKNEEAVAEINYLESCQNVVREQNQALQERITQLKLEKVGYQQKIIALQEECQRSMEEKYSLVSQIREAQDIIKELRSAGAGRTIQSKWPLS